MKKNAMGSLVTAFAVLSTLLVTNIARADATDLKGLSKPVYTHCKSVMNNRKTRFAGGASKGKGCYCITQRAITNFPEDQLDAFTMIMAERLTIAKETMKLGVTDTDKRTQILLNANARFKEIRLTSQLSEDQFNDLMQKTSKYLRVCGQKTTPAHTRTQSLVGTRPDKTHENIRHEKTPVKNTRVRSSTDLRPAYSIKSNDDYRILIAQIR